jgi:hypothetical protein
MNNNYRIFRWDPVINGTNSNNYVPMIYIKPDKQFLELIKNNNIIEAKISGTQMLYDLHTVSATAAPSSTTPNQRPNFFLKYGYYVITLDSNWYGYPTDSLGHVKFYNIPNINVKSNISENDIEIPKSEIMLSKNMYPVLLGSLISGNILLILLLVILVYIFRKKTSL